MAVDENFVLMRDAGNYFFSNEYYEEASGLYEKASVYFNSPEAKLSAAIAYIKISERREKKRVYYLRKALKHLNYLAGRWSEPVVNYYRGVVLSLLGKYEEASHDFDYFYENADDVSDFAVLIGKNFRFLLPSMDTYVYEYLYEEPLVKLYRVLNKYEIGERRLMFLKTLYGEDDEEMAKAREIKKIYEKVSDSIELKKILWSEIAREQAVALLYMWDESEKAYEEIKKRSKLYFLKTEGLPPLTASILDKIAGISLRTKGIPFFIESELNNITTISNYLKKVSRASNLNDILVDVIEFVYENGIDVEPLSSERIYRADIINFLRKILMECLDRLYRRAISYYSSRETLNLIVSVVDALPLSKTEKEEIIKMYSS